MKIRVELEMEIDLKELSITELRKLIAQAIDKDESRVIKDTRVVGFEVV